MHSKTYNIASLLIFISGICVIVSFLSPYWIQVNISKGYSEFTNIGYNLILKQTFFFTFTVGIRNKFPKNQNKNWMDLEQNFNFSSELISAIINSFNFLLYSLLGLWEVCFNNFKNVQLIGNKYIDGCVVTHSKEINALKNYLLPEWMILLQIIAITDFILTFLILIILLISFLKYFNGIIQINLVLTFLVIILGKLKFLNLNKYF